MSHGAQGRHAGGRARRAGLLRARRRELAELAALLTGDPVDAAAVVEHAAARARGRDEARLLACARLAVVRAARRRRSPWARRDPLAQVPAEQREVLALRAVGAMSVPAVAHLLDAPVGTVAARERAGLTASGCEDLDGLRALVRPWLDEALAQLPPPRPEQPGSPVRSLAGLAAVAVLAGGGALLVDVAPAPRAPERTAVSEPEPLPERPEPTTSTCAGALCEGPAPAPPLPAAEGVDVRSGTPFWPFQTDRQAADWAVAPGRLPWAGDPRDVAQHLADDLLRVRGLRARTVGGGLVALERADRRVATVRLARLGRGPERPWSVVRVESSAVHLEDVGELTPGAAVAGASSGPVDVRLLTPGGRVLARAAALGRPLAWPADWSVAALVAVRHDGTGLALQPVRRAGSVDRGVPPPGSTFVAEVDGTVRLHDALSGELLLHVSAPSGGSRDADPGRGGRDGVVFVRTEADGCTTTLLRAALDRGAGGTTVEPERVRRRLPSLSPDGRWTAWAESACGGGPEEVVVRGPDARVRRLPLGPRRLADLDARDDGAVVLQLADPDRAVLVPAAAEALPPPLAPPPGCRHGAAASAGEAVLVWEHCGATARPVLLTGSGRRAVGGPGEPVRQSSVVQAPDGLLVLAHTARGAVARLVAGRLVEVLPPCRHAPGCVLSVDW